MIAVIDYLLTCVGSRTCTCDSPLEYSILILPSSLLPLLLSSPGNSTPTTPLGWLRLCSQGRPWQLAFGAHEMASGLLASRVSIWELWVPSGALGDESIFATIERDHHRRITIRQRVEPRSLLLSKQAAWIYFARTLNRSRRVEQMQTIKISSLRPLNGSKLSAGASTGTAHNMLSCCRHGETRNLQVRLDSPDV